MAHKAFAKKKSETVELEEISFDIADEEGIVCRKRVNGKLLIELVGMVDSPEVSKQAEGILSVFDICVLTDDGENPDDYTGKRLVKHTKKELADAAAEGLEPGIDPTSSLGRLNIVADDPNTEIDVNDLAELVGWLVEGYTNRPNENAGNSRSGTRSTQGTSRRTRRGAGGTGAALTSVPPTT